MSKAYKEFGFKAERRFEEGLRKTIEWYRKEANGFHDYSTLLEVGTGLHPDLTSSFFFPRLTTSLSDYCPVMEGNHGDKRI